MELRPAAAADWASVWPIWHEVVRAGDTYAWDPDTSEAAARTLWMLPSPAEVWVAEVDGSIVGTAVVKPNQPALGSHIANASFMVSANAAGRGVGRALGERILARAAELGYRGMQFNAVVSTNIRAVALWRSLGFEIVATIPGGFRHPTEGYVDLHVMFRALP
ncbi:MAG: GNAT family N-acetyltransferase [Sporichthyaceae bacterium]